MFFLAFLLLALTRAGNDVLIWARKGAESFRWNEHVPLVLMAGASVLLVPAAFADVALWTNHLGLCAELGAGVLAWSFVHNNGYNFGRLWQAADEEFDLHANGRPYRWWLPVKLAWARFDWHYQSPTTTARFDFSAKERTYLLILGVLALANTVFNSFAGLLVAAGELAGFTICWYFGARQRRARAAEQLLLIAGNTVSV